MLICLNEFYLYGVEHIVDPMLSFSFSPFAATRLGALLLSYFFHLIILHHDTLRREQPCDIFYRLMSQVRLSKEVLFCGGYD